MFSVCKWLIFHEFVENVVVKSIKKVWIRYKLIKHSLIIDIFKGQVKIIPLEHIIIHMLLIAQVHQY